MLEQGLGRAVLFVEQHDTSSYYDVILNACLHNLALDRQIEGSCSDYMLDIIDRTRQYERYRAAILASLATLADDADEFDIDQQYSFALAFARRGDLQARQVIYDKFHLNKALDDFVGAKIIIALDGSKGFVYVAEQLGRHILAYGDEFPNAGHTYSVDQTLLSALEDEIGEAEATSVISQARDASRAIAALLSIIEETQRPRTPRLQLDPATISFDEMKAAIDARRRPPVSWIAWGKYADAQSLERAARDLLSETDPARLREYLRIFFKSAFPLDPSKLFILALDPDIRIAAPAIRVLSNIQHPSVRSFALAKISEAHHIGHMVHLLARNYQEGDWPLFEALSTKVLNRDDYHALGLGIREVFAEHPSREAVGALLNLYEHGYCSHCRERFVEALHSLNSVPEWMRTECLYDSNDDLRVGIANGFQSNSEML